MSNDNLGSGLPTEPVKPKKAAKAPKAPKKATAAAQAEKPRDPALPPGCSYVLDVRGVTVDLRKNYIVEIDEAEGQPNYETVSVNGKAYQIKRGVRVSVPGAVIAGLLDAVAARLVKVGENNGKPEYELRDYHAIPFRIMGEA